MIKIPSSHWLALSFFGYFCAYGIFVPFFPIWLKAHQYTDETIGLLIASSYIFRFVGGVFFSSLIKKASQLLMALRYFAWASCGLMLLISFSVESFWLLCLAIWLFSMVNAAGLPLVDTLATTWQHQANIDYGKVRLLGSVAFVCGVVFFGNLIGILGNEYVVMILTAALLGYALVQMATPRQLPFDEKEQQEQPPQTLWQLLKNKTTLRLLLAISLIQGSHAAYYAYSVLYWTSLGISVQTTGLLWGASILAEITLFFFSTRLFKTWTVSALFYFSAVATVIRWCGFTMAEEVWLIAIIQTFHSLTYVVNHYAIMRYISTQPSSDIPKLQGLYNGLSGAAAVALLTALSGVLYPIDPKWAFGSMILFALLAIPFIPRHVQAFSLKKGE